MQLVWLFVLAIPIASIAWTVTHEEVFRGPREYCMRQSDSHPNAACRKFFFLFTCEFCFSHYVAALFLFLTHYKLLFDDWRGYLIALFALVWVANQYMSAYATCVSISARTAWRSSTRKRKWRRWKSGERLDCYPERSNISWM